MALEAQRVYLSPDLPPGQFASKVIKAVHTDTRNNIFPCNSTYGRDWSESISYLGKKRHQVGSARERASRDKDRMQSPRVNLPLEHPLEGRNNPQPSKAFMSWRVPSRYSDDGRPTSREVRLVEQIRKDPKRASTGHQHGLTQTTHHAPPQGKFIPIQSEQQEHMQEVLKKEEMIKKFQAGKINTLPRLSFSAKPLEPRTFSAAQRWLKNNPGQEKLANQVLRQTHQSEVDQILSNTLEPNAKKAVLEWLKTATETDRRTAIKFFTSLAGKKMLQGSSGYRPAANVHGNSDARLMTILRALQENKGQAPASGVLRHETIDDNIKSLVKAARRKHLRLLTPDTRVHQREFQTWHHMPVYPFRGRVDNTRSMYVLPRAPVPKDFKIHPEWEL
uniref:Uncharacterized protein LOC100186163 n=1 Tax=Phallusia mammillata TaxID=59560 RepID=A0A6F9DJA0_9ASCI|nr:uncharacterized protein LOC100186163 [Phallusia mammillata]